MVLQVHQRKSRINSKLCTYFLFCFQSLKFCVIIPLKKQKKNNMVWTNHWMLHINYIHAQTGDKLLTSIVQDQLVPMNKALQCLQKDLSSEPNLCLTKYDYICIMWTTIYLPSIVAVKAGTSDMICVQIQSKDNVRVCTMLFRHKHSQHLFRCCLFCSCAFLIVLTHK